MFQVGDAVVHPVNGAGTVIGIQRLGRENDALQYYKIEIVDVKSKTFVLVPVKQAQSLGLRYAISEKQLEGVWHALQDPPNALPDNHKQRYGELEQRLKQQEVLQYAQIVRDLEWRRIQEDHLNVPGQRIYDKAMRFLLGELALSQGIPIQDAATQVREILIKNLSARQPALEA